MWDEQEELTSLLDGLDIFSEEFDEETTEEALPEEQKLPETAPQPKQPSAPDDGTEMPVEVGELLIETNDPMRLDLPRSSRKPRQQERSRDKAAPKEVRPGPKKRPEPKSLRSREERRPPELADLDHRPRIKKKEEVFPRPYRGGEKQPEQQKCTRERPGPEKPPCQEDMPIQRPEPDLMPMEMSERVQPKPERSDPMGRREWPDRERKQDPVRQPIRSVNRTVLLPESRKQERQSDRERMRPTLSKPAGPEPERARNKDRPARLSVEPETDRPEKRSSPGTMPGRKRRTGEETGHRERQQHSEKLPGRQQSRLTLALEVQSGRERLTLEDTPHRSRKWEPL